MTTSYKVTPADTGLTIEVTGVGGNQRQLLAAFGECQAGRCSCPTNEYQKVEAIQVEPLGDAIGIRLRAKPGTKFNTRAIAACLDYTLDKAVE